MKRVLISLFFPFVLVVAAWAQGERVSTVFQQFPQALGAYVNSTTTGGLSWQSWSESFGLRVTVGGIYSSNAWTTNALDYNVQVEIMYMMYGKDFTDWLSGSLYLAAIGGHRGIIPWEYSYTGTTTTQSQGAYSPIVSLGAGIGFELAIFQHLSTFLEFIYMGSYPLELDPSVSSGLQYRF